MDKNHLVEEFPDIIKAISELGITLATFCYDPDLQQMQSKLDTVMTEGLIGAPFVCKTPELQEFQEKMAREAITALIVQTHDPDKEVMLSKLRRLSEVPAQDLKEFARKEASAPKETPLP